MSRQELVKTLQKQVQGLRTRPSHDDVFSSGFPSLDQALTARGLVFGELVEWLGHEGSGAGTFALLAAWQAAQAGGVIVVLDREKQFYPPAAATLGIDLNKLVVIHAGSKADGLWSLDQALRCPAVAAVWAPLEQISDHDFRRLQLAAEQGQTAGMLIRSTRWLNKPSWAQLQLLVQMSTAGREEDPPVRTTGQSRDGQTVLINPSLDVSQWQIEITRSRQGLTQPQPIQGLHPFRP